MTFLATTTVDVLRGTTTNTTGDEVDDNTGDPVYAGVRASLIERDKVVWDPSTGTPRTVRVIKCRVPTHVPDETGALVELTLLDGDRVRDAGTSRIYAYDEQTVVPRSLAGMGSRTLDLKDRSNGTVSA